MTDRFPLSRKALSFDRRPLGLADIGVALATIAWLLWFFASSLTLEATSPEATVSADQRPNQVGSPIAGLVVEAPAEVGFRVQRGDLLLRFDSEAIANQLQAAVAIAEALQREIASVEALVEIERSALAQDQQGKKEAMTEALERVGSARAASTLAKAATDRAERLFELGLTSEQSIETSRVEGVQRQAEETALEASMRQLEWDFSAGQSARLARLKSVTAEIASLEGDLERARSDVSHWEEELDRTAIRSPVTGTVGAVAEIGVGSAVESGQYVATIIPDSDFEIVATFPPAEALGRIRVGQACRLLLDAYPWTRYGVLEGTVRSLGSAAREGRVPVVVTIERVPDDIRLQHGLTGTLEVEIERVSPAVATVRFLGQRRTR